MRVRFLRQTIQLSIAAMCWMGSVVAKAPADEKVAPIVPGYLRLKDEAKASAAEQGEVLLGELNCVQCHAAPQQKRIFTKGAPDLSYAGARMTSHFIRNYLLDTHGAKPGATMPDLFHASEAQSKAGAVEALTHYLVSLGGPIKPSGEEGSSVQVSHGKALFQQIGCVACHAPEKLPHATVASVPFPNLAEKTNVESLEAFLIDPSKVRPGGRMPDLHLTKADARDIAIYLLRDQLENPQSKTADSARTQGVKFTWYELKDPHSAALEKLNAAKPKGDGHIGRFSPEFPRNGRENNFGVKYVGEIHIAKAGKYKFYTTSDDGSRLYIDGQLVVDNDGVHPPGEKSGEVKLEEGDHAITLTFIQQGGGYELKAEWEGPGISRQEIPEDVLFTLGGQPMVPLNSEKFVVDPEKAQMGQMMFSAIGCVSCHGIPGARPAMRPHKALAELNPDSPTGCLGTEIPKSVPDYLLSDEQRTALKAALKNVKQLDEPLAARQQVTHLAAAFNCYACHVRDNVGGPTADRASFFVMSAEFDMGDEGRIPPRLTNIGAKLTTSAIEQIVFENKLHIRPVLATRMPSFSKEKAGAIVEALATADADSTAAVEPKFDAVIVKEGRQLFGTKGMGCVNCHGINGIKSLGMPAPDLGTVHDRLQFSWYRNLLINPAHTNPGTRMPAFWTNGEVAFKNLAGGTMDGQIAALWTYLSLGPSMAMPAGLSNGGDELTPTDTPIVHRTFFTGAGNRSIAVGYPEMVHVVFDADVVRLAKAWKGRFFDAKGMWEGRGGNHLGPLGTDVIDLPAGPSFASLSSSDAAWPEVKPSKARYQEDRNLGGRFKGYVLDKEERPTFHYVLNGVDIAEQPLPVLKSAGAELQRKFVVLSKAPAPGLTFLAAQGKTIEIKSPGEWMVDGKTMIRFSPNAVGVGQPMVRESAGMKQLLLPVSFSNGLASFVVEMSW